MQRAVKDACVKLPESGETPRGRSHLIDVQLLVAVCASTKSAVVGVI